MRPRETPWRDDPVILARLVDVERLHLAGRPGTRIAVLLGIGETTVRRDLERIRMLWRERVGGEIEDMRARVVAELEDTRVRALDAYDFDRRMEEAVLTGNVFLRDDGTLAEIQTDKDGRASFRGSKAQSLNVARQAAMDKAKVLGLVVEKVAPTDADGKTLPLAQIREVLGMGSTASG